MKEFRNREDIKVTEIEKDILRIEYPNGKILIKNIGDYHPPITQSPQPTYDSTIIDLTTIDTLLYHHKYKFWQDVTVLNDFVGTLVIDDVDNDKMIELYGFQKEYETSNDELPLKAFEFNPFTKVFEVVHTYHDTIITAKDVYDVNKDGQKQLFAVNKYSGRWGQLYKKSHPDSLATVEESSYYGITQMNDFKFGNLNNDNKTDFYYYTLEGNDTINGGGTVVVGEYNTELNRLDSLVGFLASDMGAAGFSASDVDGDGYPELVFGTIHGYVRVIEYQPGNDYQNIWNGQVETFHAYAHTATKDIDRNGKREFWVGGDAFYNGYPITRYTCFEATGNNEYVAVARIDLLGVFSFSAFNAFSIDIDKDGIEELGICVDQNFLLLKFKGSPNHHSYEIYYIKKNDLALAGESSSFYSAIMYDLLNDGKAEILISMRHSIRRPGPNLIRQFNKIYTPDNIVSVEDEMKLPVKSHIYQNYPNPFNSMTQIKFVLAESASTSITVYNLLGEKIKLLLKKDLPAGEHRVFWDGVNENGYPLNSGIYFIKLNAGKYQETIKSILLK